MSVLTGLAWTQFWQTSAVALAAGVVVYAGCRRRPHLAYLLWIIVIAKCLTPPVWSSPTGLFSWAMMTRATTKTLDPSAAVTAAIPGPAQPAVSSAPSLASQRVSSAPEVDAGPTFAWRTPATVLGIVWLGGALACGGFVVLNLARICRRLRRSALPLDPEWLAQLNECARRLALRRGVRLVVTSEPVGPAVFGFLRPVVVLPHSLVTRRPQIQLAPILSHELIHIRRGDPLAAVIQLFAQCLWWFHPLVWWANREASRERERSCDEEVLAELQLDPGVYGQCLLDILRMKQALRPVLAFPGVRAVDVTTRRLEHIMQSEPRFHVRTPRWQWAVALFAAAAALPGAGLAFDSAQRPEPNLAANLIAGSGDPNFVVIPIRTELQRKLVAKGKPVQALVELNGYALAGKRGDALMQAIGAAALRKSLAAIKAGDPNASVAFLICYSGNPSQEIRQLSQKDNEPLDEACHALANEAHVREGTRVNRTYDGLTGRWQKTVAALKDIDLTAETADESAVGDAEFSAFPVRTKITRLLTDSFRNKAPIGADCVLYLEKHLEASDRPLIEPDLEDRIERAVSKLDLPRKWGLDFHLIPANGDRPLSQRNRQAISDRFLGNESRHLVTRLGFKWFSMTF
jgi:beta-lactamase regulating signal transducer with metallopeptidase domain